MTAAREAYRVGPWYQDTMATLAGLLRVCGAEEEARGLFERLGTGEGVGDCCARAVYHLLCGEIGAGADWTEKAIAERDPGIMFYLRFQAAPDQPSVGPDRKDAEPANGRPRPPCRGPTLSDPDL